MYINAKQMIRRRNPYTSTLSLTDCLILAALAFGLYLIVERLL
jgi:hypothetical protein